MSNRAILYLRSSKDRSDVSIDAQRRALHDLAAARNLVVVDEFADAVESGKDDDRPAFQRLLRELKSPRRAWEWVLALDTSRIARRRILALIFERDCERAKVRIVFRNLPESDPATDMIIRAVFQAFDEYHSLVSKAKGLAGMAENVRQGWRAGGRAPRGYRLEYHATGAVREGEPVQKSKLVPDDDAALVGAYLKLRAAGISRGQAIARLNLPWPSTSTHSLDWAALTYAGHTVWNQHAERTGGKSVTGEKRRQRSEWVINRNTHEALITDDEAEAILAQMERAQNGRRLRASPLLLTGVLVAPDGAAWHSDGCGFYRLGKGRKVAAKPLEAAVLERIADDLGSDHAAGQLVESMRADEGAVRPIDAVALDRKVATLTSKIGRTLDLAAQLDDPAPVLRRVAELESHRAELVAQAQDVRARLAQQKAAKAIDPAAVRALLRRLVAEIIERADDEAMRAETRQAVAEVVERVELDPATLTCRLHYAVATGDSVASRREADLSPAKWAGEPFRAPGRLRLVA